ncbi:hypothetical protein GCM10025880_07690 [Methylorubrum aminovorans]|nr:hypothetical protein GCM10025880_07690 [Methylorubrum aminovorans]
MGVRGYLQLNGVAGAPDLYAALTSARTSQGALRLSLTANCCPAGTHRAGFFVRFRTEPEQQAASPVLSLTTLRRFLSELALPGSAAAGFFVSAPSRDRDQPPPHLVQALVIAGASAVSLRLMEVRGAGLAGLARDLC